MFEIRYNEQDLRNLQEALKDVPRAMQAIMSRALNRTAMMARTQIGRTFSRRIGLRIKDVRQRVILQKASYTNWRSAVAISNKRLPLIKLKAKQTRKGVTYRQIGSRERILVRHAFIATMPSGHRGVFRRATSGRLPIRELKGPSLFEVFENAQAEANQIYLESAKRLEQNIADQVKVILARRLAG